MPPRTLPPVIRAVLAPFVPLSSPRVWAHAQVLLDGALRTPVRRTVAATLRVVGLAQGRQFHRSHRVLSRTHWCGVAEGRVLPDPVVAACASDGPLVTGVDETIERRRGATIAGLECEVTLHDELFRARLEELMSRRLSVEPLPEAVAA